MDKTTVSYDDSNFYVEIAVSEEASASAEKLLKFCFEQWYDNDYFEQVAIMDCIEEIFADHGIEFELIECDCKED